ncbi:AAA family ATPase [Paraglaciecola chathamensis]|uniref:AAA family ATPase n=1 Tax=Paraglaciecola chathamensis TaxID=368405 RepID=A0ABS0WIB9_9ALTE|nr:AAA family ATPase [Paraglaciecola chathamensis]MBJ2138203.1 AAA family ATPase [Paraglaciecola chathamensis]
MKIKKITIKNFRQFWKEETLNFACGVDKNVTVIHGANGSGKTSLLNAFKWCFYGKTDFDTGNENILNEAAIQDATTGQLIEINIKVIFEQDGCNYSVVRNAKFRKLPDNKVENLKLIEFKIQKTVESGETVTSETPDSDINKVLPESLHPYFFFNGERIEKLAGVNESSQIKEAIKRLMGLKQIERAERHLKKASDSFRKINAKSSDQNYQSLTKNVAEFNGELDDAKKLLEDSKLDKEDVIKRKEDVEKKLETFKESKHLQNQRSILNQENERIIDELEKNELQRKGLIDNNRAVVLAQGLINKCEELVDLNRKKGLLPYKVRAPFIDDLIKQDICICGRKLSNDTVALSSLNKARESAGNDELDEVYSSVSYLIKNHIGSLKGYEEKLQELVKEHYKNKKVKHENENLISEIGLKISSLGNNEIESLENRLESLTLELSELDFNIRSLESSIPKLIANLAKESKELEKLEKKQKEHSLVVKRITAANNVAKAFNELNICFTDQVRRSLSERVNATFGQIIRKNVRAYIDDEFHLRIEKQSKHGEIEAKEQSTGEKQVTSLSFISSIISLAKEKHEQKGKFFKGGLYPLVMDSPFGALDDDYRFKVAERVANLADQVIIFVSNSQWNGNVKSACAARVGSTYRLIHHSTTDVAKTIENNEYLRYSNDGYEYSTLEEV